YSRSIGPSPTTWYAMRASPVLTYFVSGGPATTTVWRATDPMARSATGSGTTRMVGLAADVLARADVDVRVRVEVAAVSGEVPLDRLVGQLPVAGPEIEGNDLDGLAGAVGDRLV